MQQEPILFTTLMLLAVFAFLLGGNWYGFLGALVAGNWRHEYLDHSSSILGVCAGLDVAVLTLAHLEVGFEGRFFGAGNALPVAVTITGATFLGAFGPGTIDGRVLAAGDFSVRLFLNKGGALLAAVLGEDADSAGSAKLVALGLGAPVRPLGDLAVDGALVASAWGAVGQLGADRSTVVGKLGDGAGAGLLASSAGLVTLAVFTPLANGAVDGALVFATLTVGRHGRALATAESSSSYDGTASDLVTSTAGLGAFAPCPKDGSTAVTRTRLGVAGNGVYKSSA